MTDLEIKSSIAVIEGHTIEHITGETVFIFDRNLSDVTGIDEYIDYNPLTDDALCFQLMVEYDVELQITKERDKVDVSRGKYPKQYYAKIDRVEVMDEVIERAILLCIIEAHKEP